MIICLNAQQMEATVDISLPTFTGHHILDSTSYNSDSPPQSRWSDKYIDKNGMSITFREVFQNFKENTKSADLIKIDKSSHQAKQDRISDALIRTELLLKSNDNARPPSKSKDCAEIIENSENRHSVNLHSHIPDEKLRKIFSTSAHKEEKPENNTSHKQKNGLEDDTNNAAKDQPNHKIPSLSLALSKKGKKQKKRTKNDSRTRHIKSRKPAVPTTKIYHDSDKRLSAQSATNKSSTKNSKPRISSEPANSKPTHANVLSYTLQTFGSEKTNINNQIPFSSDYRSASDIVHLEDTKARDNNENIVPSTHYTHGFVQANTCNFVHKQSLDAISIQIQPITAQKVELSKRIKSGHSVKSEIGSINAISFQEKPSSPIARTNQFTLTAKSCNLPHMNTDNSSSTVQETSVNPKAAHPNSVSKESTLTAIYGPHNNIPPRAFSNAEDFRKVKKIFLSEKQSGTLKENGMEFPCAPPATPMPDVMKRYEYVPCMNDIRSQRAVKNKLQAMERDALRKKEKQKEANAKLEKQQSKDREKLFKANQRREIYALNKIMTDLEHRRFLEFCHAKGLNT